MSIGIATDSNDKSINNNQDIQAFSAGTRKPQPQIVETDVVINEDIFNFSRTAVAERQLFDAGQVRGANLQAQRPSPNGFDYNQIAGVRNNPNITPAFLNEVEAMSNRLGARPEHILAAMSFETGGAFSPSITNGIGATGLIQFIPGTARGLGTSTSALRRMNSTQQLEYVEKYFKPFKGNLDTLEKVYTAILSGSPKSSPNDVLFRRGTRAYAQNPLDWNRDGRITAQEATTPVTARMFGGIKAVQQRLLDGNHVRVNNRPGFADGAWGTKTAAAIRSFQEANGLPATGNLDEATGRRLFNQPNTPTRPTRPATPPSTGAIPNAGLNRGMRGSEVGKLQDLLIRLGEMTPAEKATGAGIFGPKTQSSLRDFQRNVGLSPSGNFDNATRNAMRQIFGGVRKGERSNLVNRMQDKLVQRGFMTARQKATGPGIFGPQTDAALKNFQRSRRIGVDGVFGPQSYKALFKNSGTRATNGGTNTGTTLPNTRLYNVNPGISISNTLAPKLDRLAQAYTNRTGQKLRVTSGYRSPSSQASAMANLIERRGRSYVRNLYANKTAVDQIVNAYDRGGRAEMTRVITNQVNNGTYVSNHLRSNAVDLSINTNRQVLQSIVNQLGGRILNEGDHYHIELG